MEALLRGEEKTEMMPISQAGPILYYPIRHHSPVCAWQLERLIGQYGPDCILIEGPENANHLLGVLADEGTKPPVALYYTCMEQGAQGQRGEVCQCCYPFLEHSPELVAIRAAARQGIPCAFIDLPYAQILAATQQSCGLRAQEEKISYARDRYLAQNQFQKRLCERAGLRDFEEFWEKYFELGGLLLSGEAYIAQMNGYCKLLRQNTPPQQLAEDGCLAREAHMARRIREAAQKHRRILVVAGGFHLWGLEHPQDVPEPAVQAGTVQMVYPIRYTMRLMDSLQGYASGMPAPAFYARVWSGLHQTAPQQAWEDAVLHGLVRTARALRQRGENASLFDELCAQQQVCGLTQLRDKPAPGLYELRDAVLGSYVKGEAAAFVCEPLRILNELTTGSEVGQLGDDTIVPPLVRDFDEQCRTYRLQLRDVSRMVVTLSVFSQKRHRQISRFLHQSVFLDCGFAECKKGPSLHRQHDRSLIRETWEYRWTMRVDTALTECAIYGSTMQEACTELLYRRMQEATRAREGAGLLLEAFLMGLWDRQEGLVAALERLILEDGDFISLCQACSQLHALRGWQVHDGAGDDGVCRLLARCLGRVIHLLPSMHTVDDQTVGEVQHACLMVYQITQAPALEPQRMALLDALESLEKKLPIHPALHGAALGLLYGAQPDWQHKIRQVIRGYLLGTTGLMRQSADFLQGLFFTAKDLILIDEDFLRQVDTLLCGLSDQQFMELLPQLRLAFSYFVPMETSRLAHRAAKLHGAAAVQLLGLGVDAQAYAQAEALDAWAAQQLDTILTHKEE